MNLPFLFFILTNLNIFRSSTRTNLEKITSREFSNLSQYTGALAPPSGNPIGDTHYTISAWCGPSVRVREGVEQINTVTYALSGLIRPAVFGWCL